MKKISFLVSLILICSFVFAISVNPSLDGRAIVADNGVFPPGGYYGRAPGYLPGDTVIVTNHSNGFSIDVLILGSYDAYEGIAILLSPEAADKLQITKGKDVYVKVQKKQPIPYEEAVATSRNKKITEKQDIDTDKNSSVLPGETEQLLQDVVASNKKNVIPEGDIELSYEDSETLTDTTPKSLETYLKPAEEDNSNEKEDVTENSLEIPSEQSTTAEKIENQPLEDGVLQDDFVEEISQEENVVADNFVEEVDEKELPIEEVELAQIENEDVTDDDYILIENLQNKDSEVQPVIEENEVAEIESEDNETEIAEVAESVESSEDAILADPEEYVESESIDSPVFADEVNESVTDVVVLPEEPKYEAILDDSEGEVYDYLDVIDSPIENEVVQVEPEQDIEPELPVDETDEVVLEDLSEQDIEDSTDIIPIEEISETELSQETEEVATEDISVAETSEFEEILIPEEEVALEEIPEETISEEVSGTDEEITEPEILDTDVLEEEPELAVLDYQFEPVKSENTMPETPKDIFSMIVGENPDEEILQDVVLEEADPKLPEVDDFLDSEESADADMQITLEQPEVEPVTNIAQVAVSEKSETKILPSLMKDEYSQVDELKNTVSNFNDLPKVKQTNSKTYYIQIATVSSKENVAKMVEVHGQKYPVYVLQNSSKNMYQILIGPLNDDEYALVLARFKQTYKDAFLRVLK